MISIGCCPDRGSEDRFQRVAQPSAVGAEEAPAQGGIAGTGVPPMAGVFFLAGLWGVGKALACNIKGGCY